MNEDLDKVTSPEEEELATKRAELRTLSELLAEKELELQEIKLSVNRFQNRYFSEVGCKYLELDDLLAQIAESKSRRNPSDTNARVEAKKARKKAQETTKEYQGYADLSDLIEEKSIVSEDTKKLYRKIASLIHPDKAMDDKSRDTRTQLMAELNKAYANGDVSKMRDVLSEWEASPETVSGEGTAAELVRVIRSMAQVRRRISEIEKEIAKIKSSDIHELMIAVHKAGAEGRDLLIEMATSIDVEIQRAVKELSTLR
ncbi:hypothetical protein GTO27_03865 [Candidatus Bathyarchaeota archaeon]|nr:hypothetical protein [Candidatus Bathyarchaeota archaeon]